MEHPLIIRTLDFLIKDDIKSLHWREARCNNKREKGEPYQYNERQHPITTVLCDLYHSSERCHPTTMHNHRESLTENYGKGSYYHNNMWFVP